MLTIGFPDPLYLFSLADDRQPPLTVEHRSVAWEALLRSVAEDPTLRPQVAVLVGDDDRELLAAAREGGVMRVLTVGRSEAGRFGFDHDDDFSRHLEAADARVARAPVAWNPGQPPEAKKAQVMELVRIAAWVHETDRKLLLDLVVPPVDADLEQVAGDHGRFRVELLPALVRRAVQEMRELGVEPDLWITEPNGSPADLAELSELAREAGREDVGLLVPDGVEDAEMQAAAASTGYRGFVVGRSVWAQPLAALDAEAASREQTVRAIDEAFRLRLDRFRSVTGG